MKRGFFLLFFLLNVLQTFIAKGQSNDHIFRAAPAARPYVDFDARGFLLHGKRTFLVSAGLEYARIPRALWKDRLLRLKRDGFNCIEIYTFWNFHEPQEGRFDFSGDHDLDAFLRLVKTLGMYAIVRVGPYYCAEWDLGGYPLWLRAKTGMQVRRPDTAFERYVNRFFDTLLPIVSRNQVHRGGSVILVQLENEHPRGWGTWMPDAYFADLQREALRHGLEVPYFFSGLHHGSDPAGNAPSLDDSTRPNPWFTTEFWSVWYDRYGSSREDADVYGRRTWKIIAHGGNGYNYYMAHGGTNFGYTNGHEDAASYDYGAAVGQAGDLRPIYYQFKRNAFFARSFEDILENSTNDTTYRTVSGDTAIRVTARHSAAGDIIFLDNPGHKPVEVAPTFDGRPLLTDENKLTVAPGEILPLVRGAALSPRLTLNWAAARILGVSRQGKTVTLVVYGEPGTAGALSVAGNAFGKAAGKPDAFDVIGHHAFLRFTFSAGAPLTYTLSSGEDVLRVVTVNDSLADRTWFVEAGGKSYVITGPEYVGEVRSGRPLSFLSEHFWGHPAVDSVWVYGDHFEKHMAAAQTHAATAEAPAAQAHAPTDPALALAQCQFDAPWRIGLASSPAAPAYNDKSWLKSDTALEMGSDGDRTADVWYRANLRVPDSGTYRLVAPRGGGRFIVFVDGKRVTTGNLRNLSFPVSSGSHTLALFAAHDGRDKLYNYTRSLRDIDVKGISGRVTLSDSIPVLGWRMAGGPGDTSRAADWHILAAGETADRPTFYRNTFTIKETGSHPVWRVRTTGLSHGSVWVNGHNLGRYPERVPVDGMYIPECWLRKGRNTVLIYDEYGNRPDAVSVAAETAASRDEAWQRVQ